MAIVITTALLSAMSVLGFPQGLRTFVVQSGSMEPAIKTGSLVFVMPQSDYQVDDIVTAKLDKDADIKNPAATVTHRIVEVKNENDQTSYITKGDANQSPDMNSRSKDMLIGKVVYGLPYLGYPVGFAKTQTGFIALIVIPATIIIYGELLKIKQEVITIIKNKKKKSKTKSKGGIKTLLLILSILFLSNHSSSTNSYFSAQAVISSNTVSTGFWDQNITLDGPALLLGPNPAGLLPPKTLLTDQFIIEEPVVDPVTINTSFDRPTNQLSISFINIPVNFGSYYLDKLEYEVTYDSLGLQKGLFDHITPQQVSLPLNQVDRVHFLGVCSSLGQICLPDTIDNGTVTIHLTGLVNNAPISIIKTVNL